MEPLAQSTTTPVVTTRHSNQQASNEKPKPGILPPRVREILASCPSAGDGVHLWLFTACLKLHPLYPDKTELARLLAEATAGCGRDIPDREIEDAIRNSQQALENPQAIPAVPRWPTRNEGLIQCIERKGPRLAELEASSPVSRNDGQSHTEEIIDALFPGNPLLCAGTMKEHALTRTRGEWRGFLGRQQFIVPNPMIALRGYTKAGKRSMRCLENTGLRRFLVVEFDQGSFDQHAALLSHLAEYAPMALAVHSGNKSLHGWFYCQGAPDAAVEKFFRYAVSLGADPATWTRCQYVRMPDGLRDGERRQRVVFFKPEVTEAK